MNRLLFILSLTFFLPNHHSAQAILEIEFDHIRSNKGVIRLAVYTESSQYPHTPDFTHVFTKAQLKEKLLKVRVENFKPGQYAFTVLDDENNNDAMDYNALKIPTEGYGFANNPAALFKAPPYEKSKVEIKPGMNKLNLRIRYKL